ncbi:Manganese/iron superoxide dismutase [Phellopilus nigrolimitatus]|nr:Manganese/iron superoxide dismutase [Phellopilus nigrolimitatus]
MNALGRQLSAGSLRYSRLCWNMLPSSSRRLLHSPRKLWYPIEDGVGDFLPPKALETVVEWQDGLLVRLNEQVRDSGYEAKTVLQTIIDTSADREKILIYNYACLAANNSFFLDSLKPPAPSQSSDEESISPSLYSAITSSFGTLGQLKERFVHSASGMSSSGWLWLVTDGHNRLAVIPTFGAGTLLVRSRVQMPEIDQVPVAREVDAREASSSTSSTSDAFTHLRSGPSPTSPVSGISSSFPPLNPHTPSRSIHVSGLIANGGYGLSFSPSVREPNALNAADVESARKAAHSLGSRIYPLLCLSVHEHAWMSAGLGVWGKEEYAKRFFSVLNWNKVSETFGKFQTNNRGTSSF